MMKVHETKSMFAGSFYRDKDPDVCYHFCKHNTVDVFEILEEMQIL